MQLSYEPDLPHEPDEPYKPDLLLEPNAPYEPDGTLVILQQIYFAHGYLISYPVFYIFLINPFYIFPALYTSHDLNMASYRKPRSKAGISAPADTGYVV